jgi:carbon-monoxide dehydrogenase large subunit
MSCFIEHTSRGFFPKDQIDIELSADGTVHAYSVSQTAGQGHETTFAQIMAGTLGIETGRVLLHQSPADRALIGTHSGGSRTTVGVGNVCRLAALKLIEVAKSAAAEVLATEPSQVDYAGGVLTDRPSGRTIALDELAARTGGLKTQAEATIGATFPSGCHIAEVEIDPQTGNTCVVSYVAVDDCGVAINHTIVEGQVHGGVVQGAGQVFGEQVIYDRDSGQLLTGTFMDYSMPRAGFIRRIVADEHCTPSKANPLGVKGVGESGCAGSIPSLANAMADALRPLGIVNVDMPFTPHAVWRAIRSRSGA